MFELSVLFLFLGIMSLSMSCAAIWYAHRDNVNAQRALWEARNLYRLDKEMNEWMRDTFDG